MTGGIHVRQFEFEYKNEQKLRQDLKKLIMWCKANIISDVVFHIFTEKLDTARISNMCLVISDEFPEAKYMGCTTNGNVHNAGFTGKDMIICTVFEYVSTKVEIQQYDLNSDTEADVTNIVVEYIKNNPWIKAVEFLTTIRGMSMTNFCEHMSEAPEHIKIFGGGALAENINENTAYVFSNAGSCSDHSIALLFMGGDDFYVSTSFIAGWKPLGRELHVTKAHSSELIELDNKPAYDTYYRYLRIKNDDHFFKNTLEFPFLYRCHGIDILRAPVSSMADGTLIMTSDIEEGSKARIAYGDPWTILDSIKCEAHKYTEFKPEVIAVFSCAARRTFWGDNEVTKELTPFQQIASTYGFYTSSEFQRTDKYLIQHNVTLAIATMREGEVIAYEKPVIKTDDDIQGGASMINR